MSDTEAFDSEEFDDEDQVEFLEDLGKSDLEQAIDEPVDDVEDVEDVEDIDNEDEDAETDNEETEVMEQTETAEGINEQAIRDLTYSVKHDKAHRIEYIVPDDNRITSDYIQLHEMTEAIGIRASQIEHGSPVLFDISEYDLYSYPVILAKLEFYERKSPLILMRVISETPEFVRVELWKVRDMKFQMNDIMFKEFRTIKKKTGSFEAPGEIDLFDLV